ncbi:MAG: hypothetical protein VX125_12210 [Pseudomonadota bacterium]|nr:hypothetical protein [Pseudomonadota bacterium]
MALKDCKECGNQVSDKADSCPQCGAKRKKPFSLLLFLGILFVLFSVLGSCLNKSNENKTSVNTSVGEDKLSNMDEGNFHVEVKAKRLIKNISKDPNSLKFRNITTNKTQKFGEIACGEFNSKNSLGGYIGFTRFISNGSTIFIEGENDSSIPFSKIWKEGCY